MKEEERRVRTIILFFSFVVSGICVQLSICVRPHLPVLLPRSSIEINLTYLQTNSRLSSTPQLFYNIVRLYLGKDTLSA
jgi:hypothetical protein